MTTRHLVDPEFLPLIDTVPAHAITHENLLETRAAMAARFATLPRHAVLPTRHLATGRDGAPDVPVFIYNPPGTAGLRPAILHIHGGGMIAGRPELTLFGTAPIALDLGVVVVSVEYRLAPEAPFPGPQEDCYAALAWMFDNAASLNIDPTCIAVSGDSAGGGLAANLAIMVRDRDKYRLRAQFLTCPMLDHRTGSIDDPYRNPTTGEFIWTRERNRFGWDALRGDHAIIDTSDGWFSASRADDLSRLPPAWIATGTLDLFFDENLDYARRLSAAGIAVDLHSYAGVIHGFNALVEASASKRFAAEYACAIERLVRSPLVSGSAPSSE